MSNTIGLSEYTDHDFFHARLGRGAIIVAVKRPSDDKPKHNQITPDLYVAKVFGGREQSLGGELAQLDPVESIEEKDGFVKVSVRFERTNNIKPSYHPMSALVQRIIPIGQVTFETIVENNCA